MRVVADSHTIYWYLAEPEHLSADALSALDQAGEYAGIVVSSWTCPELWMASTRKKGSGAVPRLGYEKVRAALLDPDNPETVEPFDARMWTHFEQLSMEPADPFDAAIAATASALRAPLVSHDVKLRANELVPTIW